MTGNQKTSCPQEIKNLWITGFVISGQVFQFWTTGKLNEKSKNMEKTCCDTEKLAVRQKPYHTDDVRSEKTPLEIRKLVIRKKFKNLRTASFLISSGVFSFTILFPGYLFIQLHPIP